MTSLESFKVSREGRQHNTKAQAIATELQKLPVPRQAGKSPNVLLVAASNPLKD